MPMARVMELTDGIGVDCTVECAGTQAAIDYAVKCTRKAGRLVMAGLPTDAITVPWGMMTLAELDILGVRANPNTAAPAVSYTHLRAHETRHDLVCRLLLE